ncbi:hypothetical protein SLEP1_g15720 [Rubroshorea leprosula]|uniref:Glycosyltransferases n=1 Tax=Rubroshorea leprosula TaxID=152421 RepID=A0AAV5ISI7_9ROSI|nr:hypothetical protein SLEP1_g15720 [Rubroshorea leprosula]
MASMRRTLSPVPRQGTVVPGEVCSAASPLSKSSSCAQNYPPSGGLLSSVFRLSDSQDLVLGVLSPRTSRPIERSKPKGQVWRRALFHFFICFIVGFFIGLAPFVSMNHSVDLMPKHHAFSFEVASNVGNFQTYDNSATKVASVMENVTLNSVTSKEALHEQESMAGSSNYAPANQSLLQDMEVEFHKLLIIVTPTYAQPFQAYYLNRLAYTLKLVQPPLLWIVVEMTSQSEETADILRRTGVTYRHLVCKKNVTDIKDRNVHQRNAALSHIETHRLDGIVYFADEENVYSRVLFEQMRQIRRFGTWTVAKQTGNGRKPMLEGPVCNRTQVIGWHTDLLNVRLRRFHAEMSGFAFNSTILWDPKRWHRPTPEPIRQLDAVKYSFQASTFVEQVVEDENQMEGLLQDCSRIMVWHLAVASSNSFYPEKWFMKNNLDIMAPLA